MLHSAARVHLFSHPLPAPLPLSLCSRYVIHLQDSHYALYRGVDSTQNPDTLCLACSREKQSNGQRCGVRSDTRGTSYLALLKQVATRTTRRTLEDVASVSDDSGICYQHLAC